MTKKESKYELLVKEVNKVISAYTQRLSLRQIYYRLVSAHVIENTMNEYKALSRYLVKAREEGRVSWRKIEDRARDTHGSDLGYDDYLDGDIFIKRRLEKTFSPAYFEFKKWLGQNENVEVWIEKDALSRLASNVANKYGVTVCPSKGYSSFTYIMEAVERIRRYNGDVTILYFGDYDPSGLDITRDLRDRLHAYGADVKVERICLSREQIDFHNLPPFPAKKSDVRYEKFVQRTGADDAVELDALEPNDLENYIKEAIESHINWDTWNEMREEEKAHEIELNERVNEIRTAILNAFPNLNLED